MLYASVHGVDPPVAAGKCTRLYAEVIVGNLKYQVTSNGIPTKISAFRFNQDGTVKNATGEYSSVMRRSAEENRISFFDGSNHGTYFGLERYEAEEKFYRKGEFSRVTAGMGATRTFRKCLKDYLNQKSIAVASNDSNAIRFIDTVCFWDEFGKMRDPHYEGKPLLIEDVTPDNAGLIQKYGQQIGRQKLLISQQTRTAQ